MLAKIVSTPEREPQGEALEALAALEAMPANRAAAEMKAEIIRAALTRTPPQQGRVIEKLLEELCAAAYEARTQTYGRFTDSKPFFREVLKNYTIIINEPSEENK